MVGRLNGKIALVTSAAQGIGRSTALAMANEGATVWATDIQGELLKTLEAEHSNIKTFKLDVLSADAIKAAAAQVGGL